MAQEFSLRYPLVDGQGNFGSVDGDPPAAMRYTEARLAKIAHEMLADIDRDTVDFVPELRRDRAGAGRPAGAHPEPARSTAPSGIAVGMATNIPPHNLTEVIDGLVPRDRRARDTTDRGAAADRQGPRLSDPRLHLRRRRASARRYTTGRGTITLRAQAHAEKMRGGREAIIVTELPYQVNKASAHRRRSPSSRARRSSTASAEIRDESEPCTASASCMELAQGEIAQIVLNQLYKHTADADDLRHQHAGAGRPPADGSSTLREMLDALHPTSAGKS